MTIAVFGAYGFLGKQFIAACLQQTDWHVIAVSRTVRPPFWEPAYNQRVSAKIGNVLDYDFVETVLRSTDTAYYFVHFMGHAGDMYALETEAAQTFAKAAAAVQLRRVVYMGGLAEATDADSAHLRSRYRTGVELRKVAPQVIELRASMIVGKGSVAFDVVDSLARKLPIIVLPKSSATKTQPIAVADAVQYLIAAANIAATQHLTVGIGGPEIITYRQLYIRYLRFIGKRPHVFVWPIVSPRVEARMLRLLISKTHARIAGAIVESLTTEMTVKDGLAAELFPRIRPADLAEAFRQATKT